MAITMIEFQGQIPRQQDFQTIKQNEDARPMVDYGNFQNQVNRNVEAASSQVIRRNEAEWNEEDREQGGGSYQGDGGRNRKKHVEDKIIEKKKDSFDIRI
ncbi:MAG: hypothetical protein K2K20_11360 [Lachnospiraceae bacterium]|nr:hypothetical protein [Lachnospiraceae bacterium]